MAHCYQHPSKVKMYEAPGFRTISHDESFYWLVIKNVAVDILSNLEGIWLLRLHGKVQRISTIHVLRHATSGIKTILARYPTKDAKSHAKYNIDGKEINGRLLNAVDYKTRDGPEVVNRAHRFDPTEAEAKRSVVIFGMCIDYGTKFPLSQFQNEIRKTFIDSKLIIDVVDQSQTLPGKTQLMVFVLFHRAEHADKAARVGKFDFKGLSLSVRPYKRPRKDRQAVSNLLQNNLVRVVRLIDKTRLIVCCATSNFVKEQQIACTNAVEKLPMITPGDVKKKIIVLAPTLGVYRRAELLECHDYNNPKESDMSDEMENDMPEKIVSHHDKNKQRKYKVKYVNKESEDFFETKEDLVEEFGNKMTKMIEDYNKTHNLKGVFKKYSL